MRWRRTAGSPARVLEQGVNTADQLLVVCIGGDDLFAELHGGGTCGNSHCAECHTYGFENFAEAFKLTAGFLCGFAALLDGFLVLVQLTVHIVEGGFGIVELDLPVLGAAVVLSKGGGGILQSLAKSFDFVVCSSISFRSTLFRAARTSTDLSFYRTERWRASFRSRAP